MPRLVTIAVSWLSGELPQRQIGVGWASLRTLPPPAHSPSLTVAAVDATFTDIGAVSGKGSQARRADLLGSLFAAATETEQMFLRRLLSGELRQGALGGVMADAVAKAAGLPAAAVRRAAMLGGDLPAVAAAALTGGAPALDEFTLRVGRPVGPMLAQTATGVDDALERLGGEAVFEAKLDGARVQIHRSRRRRHGLHPQPRRRHRPAARSRRGRTRAARHRPHRRRRGHRPSPRRTPAPVPGHRLPIRAKRRHRRRPSCATAFGVLLRLPAPRRRRPARRAHPPARGRPRCHRAGREPRRPAAHHRYRCRPGVSGPHAGRRPRGRDGQVAVEPVRGGPARRGLAEGQTRAHPRPGGAGRGMGLGSADRQAVQHPPRCARSGQWRIRHAGQDVQGHDRRHAGLADRAVHRTGHQSRSTSTW